MSSLGDVAAKWSCWKNIQLSIFNTQCSSVGSAVVYSGFVFAKFLFDYWKLLVEHWIFFKALLYKIKQ